MPPSADSTVDLADLRIGLFVHLDLGWMDHPFPLSSFKISSQQQIDTIRTLGLKRLRYSPEKSDPPATDTPDTPDAAPVAPLPGAQAGPAADDLSHAELTERPAHLPRDGVGDETRRQTLLQAGRSGGPHSGYGLTPEELAERDQKRSMLAAQRQSLAQCEKQFSEATRTYKTMVEELEHKPQAARDRGMVVINGLVDQMSSNGESVIRLLSEGLGDRTSMHSVNVTVLSLLLGRAMKLDDAALTHLGAAALMHDLGKTQINERVRFREDSFSAPQLRMYQEHVAHSVQIGRKMELPAPVLLYISQHHELADGTGFPLGLKQEKIAAPSSILALVNRYDGLCNPGNPSAALTPHEALSLMFAQMKARFDGATLSAFIRMMGVYPPGSVVQLVDGRYALVVSVNSSRPLKPRVIVHEPGVPRDDALILDLETSTDLGIKRSMRPLQLPRSTLDYLSPRARICYFFERAAEPDSAG